MTQIGAATFLAAALLPFASDAALAAAIAPYVRLEAQNFRTQIDGKPVDL